MTAELISEPPAARVPTRDEIARQRAEQICADFTYERTASRDEAGRGADVWRCRGKDFDHCHDLVITGYGIAAYGDMDPLVFSVPGRGLGLLAGRDVSYYLYSKLDGSLKKETVEEGALYAMVAESIYSYADDIWMGPGAQSLPDGPVAEALERVRSAKPHEAKAALDAFALECTRSSVTGSGWDAWCDKAGFATLIHPVSVGTRLEDLLDDLVNAGDSVNEVCRVLSETGEDFGDAFRDLEPSVFSAPCLSVLTRLHILNIGAQRIQAQLEAEGEGAAAWRSVDRPRG